MNTYYNPVRTIQGAGSFNRLPEVLEQICPDGGRVLVIGWDEKLFSHPVFFKLEKFDVQTLVFTASNPTVGQLFETFQNTRAFSPEVIVGIGGGSIMDVSKSLCCLYQSEVADVDALREYIQNKRFGKPSARWIGVPTTSGTGSEVTCWATIWDPEKDAKRSVESQENYAYAALVDPQLTYEMPLKLAVSSALDAVAHAVEAYWAKGTNLVSRALALEAIRTIMNNMESLLCREPSACDAMSKGSMLAGMAFSNTKTTACHSISYPLTMHHHIPHGTAVSMLLSPVLEMNAPSVEGMEQLLAALGIDDARQLKECISEFLVRSGQPASLGGWGVQAEECAELAKLGMTKGRADNNPVELTAEKIEKILLSVC